MLSILADKHSACKPSIVLHFWRRKSLKVRFHLLLFSNFLRTKSSHLNRNLPDREFCVKVKVFSINASKLVTWIRYLQLINQGVTQYCNPLLSNVTFPSSLVPSQTLKASSIAGGLPSLISLWNVDLWALLVCLFSPPLIWALIRALQLGLSRAAALHHTMS